jgi:hypothetical protein
MVDGPNPNNFKHIFVDAMVSFGHLKQNTITQTNITPYLVDTKLTCVIVQLKDQNAPFIINVHCMNHCTNLAI